MSKTQIHSSSIVYQENKIESQSKTVVRCIQNEIKTIPRPCQDRVKTMSRPCQDHAKTIFVETMFGKTMFVKTMSCFFKIVFFETNWIQYDPVWPNMIQSDTMILVDVHLILHA